MLSLTGHGRAQTKAAFGLVTLEISAVNHRFFEIRTHVPAALPRAFKHAIETHVKTKLQRGHVEVYVRVDWDASATFSIDHDLAKRAWDEFTKLRNALRSKSELSISDLGRVPGVFRTLDISHDADNETVFITLADHACDALLEMRAREGRTLEQDFSSRIDKLKAGLTVLTKGHQALQATRKQELLARIEELRKNDQLPGQDTIDHVLSALLTHGDVAEELTRLASHFDQLETAVHSQEPASGRRIEFLLQELHREINTFGNKATDPALSEQVISFKLELERMREQSANVW